MNPQDAARAVDLVRKIRELQAFDPLDFVGNAKKSINTVAQVGKSMFVDPLVKDYEEAKTAIQNPKAWVNKLTDVNSINPNNPEMKSLIANTPTSYMMGGVQAVDNVVKGLAPRVIQGTEDMVQNVPKQLERNVVNSVKAVENFKGMGGTKEQIALKIASEEKLASDFVSKVSPQLKDTGVRMTDNSIGVLKGNIRGGWIDNEDVFTFYPTKVIPEEMRIELEKVLPKNIKVSNSGIDIPKDFVPPVEGGVKIPSGLEFIKSKEQYNPLTTSFDIKKGNEIIGKIAYKRELGKTINLSNININPELRQQGIGTNVIDKIFQDNPNFNKIKFQVPDEVPLFWKKIGAEFSSKGEGMELIRSNFYNKLQK